MRALMPGPGELAIILVIVLILFGPKRLPQLGKMLGKTVRNVREGIEGKLEEDDEPDKLDAASDTEVKASKAKVEEEA